MMASNRLLMILFLSLMAYVQITEGRVGVGPCATPPTQSNFQLDRYLGQWYSQVEFSALFNLGVSCSRANYSIKPDLHVKVLNQGYYKLFDKHVEIEGDAYVFSGGKLMVKFFSYMPAAPYLVVETDYDTFAVVYSCRKLGFIKTETAWVLTRNQEGVNEGELDRIYHMLRRNNIDPSHFNTVDQTACQN